MDRGKSGAGGGLRAKNKWALYPFLSFLMPHITPRRRCVAVVKFYKESSELYKGLLLKKKFQAKFGIVQSVLLITICRSVSNLDSDDGDDNSDVDRDHVVTVSMDADAAVDERNEPTVTKQRTVEPGKRNLKKVVKNDGLEGHVMQLINSDKSNDEDEMFLRSLLSSFKKCGNNKALVKIKIMQLMLEYEEKALVPNVPPAVASTSTGFSGDMGGGGDHGYSNQQQAQGFTNVGNLYGEQQQQQQVQGGQQGMYNPNFGNQQGPVIIHDMQRSYRNLN